MEEFGKEVDNPDIALREMLEVELRNLRSEMSQMRTELRTVREALFGLSRDVRASGSVSRGGW